MESLIVRLTKSIARRRIVFFRDCVPFTSRKVNSIASLEDSTDGRDEEETTSLSAVKTDLSSITPHFPKTFNLAAYVNKSDTLKKLIDLRVDLSKIEKKPFVVEKLLKLDFENNIKRHLLFLNDYVEIADLGSFITKNPMVLVESVDDLQVRVNYLLSKHFQPSQIKHIINKNPYWLMFSSTRIDKRLGYYQEKFSLSGHEVRDLAVKNPKLITYNLEHVKTNTFVIKEEMGFEDDEVKKLILKRPKLWMLNQRSLLQRFHYIHNVIKIPHKTMLQSPQILECRNFKIKQRHTFLEKLGRAQFSPQKENYVPIMALAEGTDAEFCAKYAKCTVSDFNNYLKTL